MKYIEQFSIGDTIRLTDGDGRHHIIKEFQWEYDVYGNKYMATVIFEDNAAKGFISETFTDMIKVY
jgi:hypothetical protein